MFSQTLFSDYQWLVDLLNVKCGGHWRSSVLKAMTVNNRVYAKVKVIRILGHYQLKIAMPFKGNSSDTHQLAHDKWLPVVSFIFFKKIGEYRSFLWGHWYPCFGFLVTFPLGFKARVGSLTCTWQRCRCYILPEIHLWCDTCWPPLVWHLPTSWWPTWQLSHLFHIPARHWWDSKPGAIMPPPTVWDQADALLTELSRLGCVVSFMNKSYIIKVFRNKKTIGIKCLRRES